MAIADIAINIVTKGSQLAKRQLDNLGKGAEGSSKALAGLGKVMAGAVALGAVAMVKVLADATKQFIEFDDAMTQSLAIMKTTTEQQDAMALTARRVATETRIGATESAEAFFFLASAGLDAEQSIQALPQVAQFAQAGMFDMATATDLATDAQSALGLTVDDAQQNLQNLTRVTDVLVKANTLANASVQQFSEALTNKAGAALKVVNKDIEEGVAVLAVFADRGVKGAEAGEKLNQVLRDIPRATAKNKEEFNKLGLQMFDTNGKLRNVADLVEELDRVLGPMSDEMKASTLDTLGLNRGVADAVKILSGASDEIRTYEESLRNAGGTTQEVADKQVESLAGQLDILRSRFDELKLTMIETNEDGIRVMIDGMNRFLDSTINNIPKIKIYLQTLKESTDQYGLFGGALNFAITGTDRMNAKLDELYSNTDEQNRQWEILTYNLQNMDATLGTVEERFAEQARQYAYNLQASEEYTQQLQDEKEKEEELAKAREDKALGSLNKVMSAYKKYTAIFENIEDLQGEVNDAQKKLNKQREQEKLANKQVQTALDELNKQKEISKQVTLEEQLAIERQRESIKRLEEQEERSKVQNLELQLAKQRLTELIDASTSATNTEEQAQRQYEQALKEVERQQEATKKAQEEYRQAQEDLAKATEKNTENLLEMAIAKKALDDAIADAEAIGALENGLKQMVKSVGGDLDTLKAKFQSIFDLQGKSVPSFTPSGGGGGGGGNGGGSETFDPLGNLKEDATGTSTTSKGKFDFSLGQRGGVTTINNIQVAVEGALSDKQNIQDAVAIAVIEAQKRGTKVIL